MAIGDELLQRGGWRSKPEEAHSAVGVWLGLLVLALSVLPHAARAQQSRCVNTVGNSACGYDCKTRLADAKCAQTPWGACRATTTELRCWDPDPQRIYASGVQPRKAECIDRLGQVVCGYDCKSTVSEARCAQTPAGRCTTRLSEVICWDPPFDVRTAQRPPPDWGRAPPRPPVIQGPGAGWGTQARRAPYAGRAQASLAQATSREGEHRRETRGKARLVLDPVHRRSPAFHTFLKGVIKRQRKIGGWYEALLRSSHELRFHFTECDGFMSYSSPPPEIRTCYGYVEKLREALSTGGAEGGGLAEAAVAFTTLHELGHALIHMLDLPMVGRGEDAADSFAMILILQSYDPEDAAPGQRAGVDRYVRAALSLFNWFDTLGKQARADEHGTPVQRAFNVACLTKGRDLALARRVVGPKSLQALKGRDCAREYRKGLHSWNALLKPYSNVLGGETF